MWIRKSTWKIEKEYCKAQDELIEKQKSLIKILNEQIDDLKDYTQKIENHYEDLNKICKNVISNNGSMIEHIRSLEMKNKALQASLDEAIKQIEKLKGEN